MTRQEQKREDCWALEDLYATKEQWENEIQEVTEEIDKISGYEGRLLEGGEVLLEYLNLERSISGKLERIYVYANEKLHENTKDAASQKMAGKAMTVMMAAEVAGAFFEPELMKIPEDTFTQYLSVPGMEFYKRKLMESYRKKSHICSKEIEDLLANVREVTDGPSDIFSMFNNADVTFQSVKMEDGKEYPVTHGTYISLMENREREIRRQAFENMYAGYEKFENTLSAIFKNNVKQFTFYAKARQYDSSLAYALDDANVPVTVYKQLIETVNHHLDLMHQYVAVRRQALGVDKLHMYDLYVPMVEGVQKKYTFEDAKQIVLEGLSPLGEDYLAKLKEGFENRWIDIYENEGKRSGAYSWGAYGTHPYVLLNYQGSLNDVFTLAHEMGHALHSYYSDANQDIVYAGYKIFVAEVASTCNESLLIHYLLDKTEDKKERAYLINHFLEQFKGTLYRQTMFAEFEMITHDMVERHEELTPESIQKVYYDLNKKYFGEDDIILDSQIGMEWARIPHFYTPFYVYQYATGFSAAIAISKAILAGDEKVLTGYQKFLCSGSTMDPIDLLRLAGVDMDTKEPVEKALELFGELLEEFKKEN